jgi:hypothetical protein
MSHRNNALGVTSDQDAAEVERIITAAAEYYSNISGNESTASQRI